VVNQVNRSLAVVAPMKLTEFKEGISRYKRLLSVLAGVTIVACLVWAAVITTFSATLDRFGARVFGAANSRWIAPTTLSIVCVVMLATSAIVQRIAERDVRTRCPHCGAFLAKQSSNRIVIATKNCTCCGERVIDGSQ
jgi:hypothetical protein